MRLIPTRSLRADLSASALMAGFVAVLVGYTSSVAVVFAAAQALGATAAQTTSWLWALGLGMGLTSFGLAWWTRTPLLTAWSTPGAAVLAATQGVPMAEALGACLLAGLAMAAAGFSGAFERAMNRIPQSIAAALLAGVLTRFGLDAVLALRSAPGLVLCMLAVFLLARRLWPRMAVPLTLLAGLLWVLLAGQLHAEGVRWAWAGPLWTTPVFSWAAAVGVALPLFVVTMASQNLPGVAAQRAAGYTPPVSLAVGVTGLATALLAPFGGYALNLAAITAAICAGPQSHEDPQRRYVAVLAAGVFYVLAGLAAGAVVGLLAAVPKALVLVIAGLALLATIGNGLELALRTPAERDAAVLTFLVTLSGLSIAGIGSAFWGVVAGGLALISQRWRHAG